MSKINNLRSAAFRVKEACAKQWDKRNIINSDTEMIKELLDTKVKYQILVSYPEVWRDVSKQVYELTQDTGDNHRIIIVVEE